LAKVKMERDALDEDSYSYFFTVAVAVSVGLAWRIISFLKSLPKGAVITYSRLRSQDRNLSVWYSYFLATLGMSCACTLMWLYSFIYLPGSMIIDFISYCTNCGKNKIEKKLKKEDAWQPLTVDFMLQSEEYEVFICEAPVGAPTGLLQYNRETGINHTGIGFKSPKQDFVIDYQAVDGMFNAILPYFDFGFQLFPPKPTTALYWKNQTNTFKYKLIDRSYWEKITPICVMTKDEVNAYLNFSRQYPLDHPRYLLHEVWNDDLSTCYYEDSTCSKFLFESLHFISSMKTLYNVENIKRKVSLFSSETKPEESGYETSMITEFFRDMKQEYTKKLMNFLDGQHDDFWIELLECIVTIVLEKKPSAFVYQNNADGEEIYVKLNGCGTHIIDRYYVEEKQMKDKKRMKQSKISVTRINAKRKIAQDHASAI